MADQPVQRPIGSPAPAQPRAATSALALETAWRPAAEAASTVAPKIRPALQAKNHTAETVNPAAGKVKRSDAVAIKVGRASAVPAAQSTLSPATAVAAMQASEPLSLGLTDPGAFGQATAATPRSKAAPTPTGPPVMAKPRGQALVEAPTGAPLQAAGQAGASPGIGGPAQAMKAAPAPGHERPSPGPAGQIAVQISQATRSGIDTISMRLHPAELGRVEIKLDIGSKGQVQAVVTVDRPDTLELLQRDSRQLEKALTDAGLDADSDSLDFNLRGRQQRFAGTSEDTDSSLRLAGEADDEVAPGAAAALPASARGAPGSIDILV